MSREIDEKVVEMQFDNRQFEEGVQQSLSTIDKLKQALKFEGIRKGFQEIDKGASETNLSGLQKGLSAVSEKFSAMEVVAVTALANITNSAVNAGKRLVKSLTVDPVSDGYKEYELKMGSVQTIMASTGETLEKVNGYLEELNEYSDKTIYSFSDMTNNIGKFTNAGVSLKDAVLAIKGVSNEAALAGANSNEASRAMYNFAQALSAGYVKLIDWKSIENANMATKSFKEELINTAVEVGTLTKQTDGMYYTGKRAISATQNFNDSLTDQWMTTEVLVKTLQKYADETTEIGKKAFASAQDIKTWTMMMDTLKEAVGSGWAQSFELLIGDFEEAKQLFTALGGTIGNIIDKTSDMRNGILEAALGKQFSDAGKGLTAMIKPVTKIAEVLKSTQEIANDVINGAFGSGDDRLNRLTEAGYNYYEVQNKINETLGNAFRYTSDIIEAQDKLLVTQKKSSKVEKTSSETLEETAKTTVELTDAEKDRIATLARCSDEQLKQMGYTKKQIKTFRDLAKASDDLGISIREYLDNATDIDGRWILIDSFKNIGKTVLSVGKTIRDAWREVIFGTADDNVVMIKQAELLNKVITGFHKLTTYIKFTDADLGKLKTTFKGVFAIVDILTTIIKGPLKLGLKFASEILKSLKIGVLDISSALAKGIIKVRDWLDSLFDFSGIAQKIAPIAQKAATKINTWATTIGNWVRKNIHLSDIFRKVTNWINNAWGAVRNWVRELKLAKDKPKKIADAFISAFKSIKDFLAGLFPTITKMLNGDFETEGKGFLAKFANGFVRGTGVVVKAVTDFGKLVVSGLKSMFSKGAEEASDEFNQKISDGVDEEKKSILDRIKTAFKGVAASVKNFNVQELWSNIKGFISKIGSKVKEELEAFSTSKVFGAILSAGYIALFFKIIDLLKKITGIIKVLASPLKGLNKLLTNAGIGLKNFLGGLGRYFTGSGFAQIGKGILLMATAIAVLAGSLWVITERVSSDRLWESIGAIGALAGILALLSLALLGMSKLFGKIDISSLAASILAMGAGLALLAIAAHALDDLSESGLKRGLACVVIFGLIMGLLAKALGGGNSVIKGDGKSAFLAPAAAIIAIGLIFAEMVWVCKTIGKMDDDALKKGLIAVTIFGLLASLLVASSKTINKSSGAKAAQSIKSIGTCMLLMAVTLKIMSTVPWTSIVKGVAGVIAFTVMAGLLVLLARVAPDRDISTSAKLIKSIALCMLAMAVVAKVTGSMTWDELKKDVVAVTALGAIAVGLIAATKLAGTGNNMKSAAVLILAVTACMFVLGGLAVILGLVPIEQLEKGMTVISILTALVSGLMFFSKYASGGLSTIIGIAVLLTIAVGSLIALSILVKDNEDNFELALKVLGGLFAGLSVLMLSAKGLGGNNQSFLKVLGICAVLVLMVAAIGAVMIGLMHFMKGSDPKEVVGIMGGLSLILVALSTCAYILGSIKGDVGSMMSGVLVVATLGLALLGLAYIFNIISGWNLALDFKMAMELAALLGVLTVLTAALGVVGMLSIGAIISGLVGLVVVMTILGALAVGIGEVFKNVTPEQLESWKNGITAFNELMVVLCRGIGEIVAALVEGAASMLLTILPDIGQAISDFGEKLAPFFDMIGGLTVAHLEGAGILAGALVAFGVGSLIAAVTTLMGASLPALGLALSGFAINAGLFFAALMTIGPDVLNGADNLGKMILALTAADILNGIAGIFGGESSLSDFGEELAKFGPSLATFAHSLNGVDLNALSVGSSAALELANMIKILPATGGLPAFFNGTTDMDKLGDDLEGFGGALVRYGTSINSLDDPKIRQIKSSAKAAEALVDVAKNIPESGGWLGAIIGENDMDSFGSMLAKFGVSLCGYADTVAPLFEDGGKASAIENSVPLSEKLVELSKKIPVSGGLWDLIAGGNDMDKFGEMLASYGNSLVLFSIKTAALNTDAAHKKIDNAIAMTEKLVKMAELMPESSGLWGVFAGKDHDMEDFSVQLGYFGEALLRFGNYTSDLKSYNVLKATDTITDIIGLATSENFDSFITSGAIDLFIVRIPLLGTALASFSSSALMINTKAVGTAVTSITDLITVLEENASGISNIDILSTSLQNLTSGTVNSFLSAMNDLVPQAYNYGTGIINELQKGMMDRQTRADLLSAFSVLIVDTLGRVKYFYSEFVTAGINLDKGLISGINSYAKNVYAAGYNLGQLAIQGERDGQESRSPSKLAEQSGEWIDEGVILGMKNLEGRVYKKGYDVGKTATSSISDAIAYAGKYLGSDFDSQPVIRPVLDLSDVRAGSQFIRQMLSPMGLNFGINLGGDAAMLASSIARNQNGTNLLQLLVDMQSDIEELSENMSHMQMVLDSGTLVGELSPGIDSELGQISVFKGRGN